MFSGVSSSLADIRRQAKKDNEVGQVAAGTEIDANTRRNVTNDTQTGRMADNTITDANSSRYLMDYFEDPRNVGGVLPSTSFRINTGTITSRKRDPNAEPSPAHLVTKVPVQMPMGGWVRMQWRKGESSPHLPHANTCKCSQTNQPNVEQITRARGRTLQDEPPWET